MFKRYQVLLTLLLLVKCIYAQSISISVNSNIVVSSDTVQVCQAAITGLTLSHTGVGIASYEWSLQNQALTDSSLQTFSYSFLTTGGLPG